MKRRFITVSEAFKTISKNEDDLTDIEKDNIQYTEAFNRYGRKDVSKIAKDIKKIADMPDKVVVKIVDLKPESKEEMTAVLSSYSVMLSEEDLNTLMDYFAGL